MLKINTKTSRTDLVHAWRKCFKTREPNKAGIRALRTCLHVKAQRQGHIGDYNITEAKLLSRHKRYKTGVARLQQRASLPIGSELIRSYRGQTHVVNVKPEGCEWEGKPEGCEWEGKPYSSLSRIDHEITGSHLSGPKFFGLNV